MLRAAVADGTAVGRLAKRVMDRGELVSDAVIVRMVAERIDRPDCRAGFLLDGFPRSLAQAEALDELLVARGLRLDGAIELVVEDEVLVRRLAGRFVCGACGAGYHDRYRRPETEGACDVCGESRFLRRDDDKEETVRARLGVYRDRTAPLLPYFEARGVLSKVDGMAGIDTVTRRIRESLAGLAGSVLRD